MNNLNSKHKCLKCLKYIPISSKKLHDLQCNYKENNLSKCNECKNFIYINDYDDHMLCHMLQDDNEKIMKFQDNYEIEENFENEENLDLDQELKNYENKNNTKFLNRKRSIFNLNNLNRRVGSNYHEESRNNIEDNQLFKENVDSEENLENSEIGNSNFSAENELNKATHNICDKYLFRNRHLNVSNLLKNRSSIYENCSNSNDNEKLEEYEDSEVNYDKNEENSEENSYSLKYEENKASTNLNTYIHKNIFNQFNRRILNRNDNDDFNNEISTLERRYQNELDDYLNESQGEEMLIADIQNIQDEIELFNEITEKKINPVDDSILNILPRSKIKKVNNLPQEKRSCVICIEEFKENELVITIPCYHIYHENCAKKWFQNENICPICKFKLDKKNLIIN